MVCDVRAINRLGLPQRDTRAGGKWLHVANQHTTSGPAPALAPAFALAPAPAPASATLASWGIKVDRVETPKALLNHCRQCSLNKF
jgi:hypothetical protein